MERPATWKVVTVGAALTGLSVLGAGAANAATGPAPAAPASVTAGTAVDVPLGWPFDDYIDPWVRDYDSFYGFSGGSWDSGWGSS